MLVYLIRHGETTGDVEDRFGGDYDDDLSEKGKLQAQELAKKLVNKNIEVLFHSSRARAVETATIVSKLTNIPRACVPDLRERNQYGVLTGLIKSEAKIKFPSEVEKLSVHPYNNFVTNSESYDSFKDRAINIFLQLSKSKEKTIGILTHGGIIKALFRELFHFGEFKKLGDCAILVIKVDENKYSLVSMDNAELEK